MAVLVVDDNSLNRRIVQVHLQRLGQTVIAAHDGFEAITALETTPEIDLVVTDVMMPGLDGWGLIGRMRERPEWRGIPVIVCSAYADLENVQRARELGIHDFLVKPISGESLSRAVRARVRQSAPRLAPAATIVARLGISRDDYHQVVGDFVRELPSYQARLHAMIDGAEGAPEVDGLMQALGDLAESCEILGAERTLTLIERMRSERAMAASADEQRQLQRELVLLASALSARIEELQGRAS